MDLTIIDLKLIDAWSVLCFSKDDGAKEITEIIAELQVPEKYSGEVSIRIANRRIEKLSQE